MASTVLIAQIFLLPETLRSLVGNGSGYANPTPYQFWKHHMEHKKSWLPEEQKRQIFNKATVASGSNISYMSTDDIRTVVNIKAAESITKPIKKSEKAKVIIGKIFQSAAYLKEKDVATILLYSSLDFAAMHCILSSMTPLYTRVYGIDEFHVGFCFLSPGFGAFIGSYFSGKIMNWRFRCVAKKFGAESEQFNR
jgi:hypothetical protein